MKPAFGRFACALPGLRVLCSSSAVAARKKQEAQPVAEWYFPTLQDWIAVTAEELRQSIITPQF